MIDLLITNAALPDGRTGIRACIDAVTVNAAKVMHLDNNGIGRGRDASFVLLEARDVVKAIRLRANRLNAS